MLEQWAILFGKYLTLMAPRVATIVGALPQSLSTIRPAAFEYYVAPVALTHSTLVDTKRL